MSKIVTANLLATGTVVFLDGQGRWVHQVDQARLYPDVAAAEAGLALAHQTAVVDPFVTDKVPPSDGKRGMTLRDSIRAFGPTVAFRCSAGKTA